MTSPSHAYDSSVISHLLSVASLEQAELEHVRKHALTTRIHDDLELREYATPARMGERTNCVGIRIRIRIRYIRCM